MRVPVLLMTGLLLTVLSPSVPPALQAQVASTPLPTWQGGPLQWDRAPRSLPVHDLARFPSRESSATRSHTGLGLLIGGLVGAAVTTVFLIGFCGTDSSCGADEVGRAALVFAVPPAAVGALIGSLIRTKS